MERNGTNLTLPGDQCSDSSKTTSYISAVIQIAVYCILLVLSLLGNSLVMLVVSRTREIRTTVNFFIFNMAVSDLVFTIVITPRKITEVISDIEQPWYLSGALGSVTCKACYFAQDVCAAVSMLTLVAIAADRYYAIVFPMRSGVITSKIRKLMVISIWIIAMAFQSPYFYAFRLIPVRNTDLLECKYIWKGKGGMAYYFSSSAFLFFLPLFTMTVIYTVILITIRRRKIPGNLESSRARRHKERRNRRVLKMVLAVLLAFLICWLPVNIYAHLKLFGFSGLHQQSKCGAENMTLVVTKFFAYTNAAINPFIYFAFSENYRIAAINIIKCRSKRQLARRENTSLIARASLFPATAIKNRTLKVHLELTALHEVLNEGES